MPSRGLVAEKTSMLHLRGEYSWVTVHPWNASESERGSWWAEGGTLDRIEEETEERKGGRGRYRQLAGSYIELRSGAYLSTSPSDLSPPTLASFLVRPPSILLPRHPPPAYFISAGRQRFRGTPTTADGVTPSAPYISVDTDAKVAIDCGRKVWFKRGREG